MHVDDTFGQHAPWSPYALYAVERRTAHCLTYQYAPMANAAALRTVLSKHTVKRLRELVRTRINLSGYSKMAKQDLISAILKRKKLFTDILYSVLFNLEIARRPTATPFGDV